MYLNDLNSAKHSVEKLNRVLATTFDHDVNIAEMSTDSLSRMLTATEAKMMAIKESDLKYWENPQYNKLGLIQHQLKTFINEVAPARADGKKMKARSESKVMEDNIETAEVMLAAQELVDEVQKMVEDLAEMQVQKLMPIVDAMKEQIGFEQAEAYNAAVDAALGGLLDQAKMTKETVENATLATRGEAPTVPAPTDMAAPAAPEGDDMDVDVDMEDDFEGDPAAAGEENTVGRELKGESALASLEKDALAEKKFLESKDRLFKMVESGQMSQEHFINVINELDSYVRPRNNADKLNWDANTGRSNNPGLGIPSGYIDYDDGTFEPDTRPGYAARKTPITRKMDKDNRTGNRNYGTGLDAKGNPYEDAASFLTNVGRKASEVLGIGGRAKTQPQPISPQPPLPVPSMPEKPSKMDRDAEAGNRGYGSGKDHQGYPWDRARAAQPGRGNRAN